MHPFLAALLLLILLAALVLLLVGAWIAVAGDREDEHWPMGLDEDATLDVQSHVGDSRSIR